MSAGFWHMTLNTERTFGAGLMMGVLFECLLMRADEGAKAVTLYAGTVAFGFFGGIGQSVRVVAVDTGDTVGIHCIVDILVTLCTVLLGCPVGPELFALFAGSERCGEFVRYQCFARFIPFGVVDCLHPELLLGGIGILQTFVPVTHVALQADFIGADGIKKIRFEDG